MSDQPLDIPYDLVLDEDGKPDEDRDPHEVLEEFRAEVARLEAEQAEQR